MARYIDAEKVLSAVCSGCNKEFSDEPCEPDTCAIRRAINDTPTADVVEVVRCKDCRFNKPTDFTGKRACIKQSAYKTPDDFCSYGERIT